MKKMIIAVLASASLMTVSLPSYAKSYSKHHSTKKVRKHKTTKVRKHKSSRVTTSCGSKRYCKQMTSCKEARYYFKQCGLKKLDRDKDGIPCENVCKR